MSIASREARQFLLPFHLHCFSSADLEQALLLRGYTLVEFSRTSNDRDITTLLNALCLSEYAAQHAAFTYADANLRIVFLQENLSEQERQILLSHELGHVCCRHLESAHPSLSGVVEEQEANEFAGRLITYNQRCHLIRKTLLGVAILCCVAILAGLLLRGGSSNTTRAMSGSDEVCLTHSGECYHQSNCTFVQGKNNIIYVTRAEAEASGYKPCQYCFGNS